MGGREDGRGGGEGTGRRREAAARPRTSRAARCKWHSSCQHTWSRDTLPQRQPPARPKRRRYGDGAAGARGLSDGPVAAPWLAGSLDGGWREPVSHFGAPRSTRRKGGGRACAHGMAKARPGQALASSASRRPVFYLIRPRGKPGRPGRKVAVRARARRGRAPRASAAPPRRAPPPRRRPHMPAGRPAYRMYLFACARPPVRQEQARPCFSFPHAPSCRGPLARQGAPAGSGTRGVPGACPRAGRPVGSGVGRRASGAAAAPARIGGARTDDK